MSAEFSSASLKAIPSGRTEHPDEIANAVRFLASRDSGYLNGITLNVDGGLIRY
ncbi:TPA: SDR family oxidoreductase [Klebsiella oxytoca]|nr:SDR family oxidoreductase [Klebsiella oxytoca]